MSVPSDRSSDRPLVVDLTRGARETRGRLLARGWASPLPRSWVGASGYLLAGVLVGLVVIVIVALGMTASGSPLTAAAAGIVTDNVIHVKASQIGQSCFRGVDQNVAVRLTVSLEIGLDGKVRSATATGQSPALRACVQAHVRGWEFLPQANPSQMVLPLEIDPH